MYGISASRRHAMSATCISEALQRGGCEDAMKSNLFTRAAATWLGCALVVGTGHAQTTMLPSIQKTLDSAVQTPAVTRFQLERYLMARFPSLPQISTPQRWTAEKGRLRRHMLDDVAFHGWPREWVESAPHFEDAGVVEAGHGYKVRKFLY